MRTNLDWPELPQKYIDEAINSKFELIHTPSILYWAPTSFVESDLYKKISSKYRCGARYFLNPPHTLYDWHIDNKRSCAINWVINSNTKCMTLYREPIPEGITKEGKKLLYNLTEVLYNGHKPTLLNTKKEHCVINNSDDDRIILSVTIFDTTYEDALLFLKDMNV